jgi:tol-pal system protein YbgF
MAAAKRASAAAVPVAPAVPALDPAKASQDEVLTLRQDLAGLSNSLDGVRTDLRAVGTRTDENKVEARKEISRLNGETSDAKVALTEIRGRLSKLDAIDRRLSTLEERLEKALPPSRIGGAGAPTPTEWKTPEDMYDFGYGTLIRGNDPVKARGIFDAFLVKYPSHKLVPNAYYWRGESYFAEKDYENAIVAFQDVIDKFPATEKSADAMFKQGLSFLALNDKKNARTLFELLQVKYPKAAAAEKARQKLAELK